MEAGAALLRKELVERGRKFVEAVGVKHMYYSGLTIDTRDEVESQVVVDFEAAFIWEAKESWRPVIKPLVALAYNLGAENKAQSCTADCCLRENVHDDGYVETERSKKFTNDLMAETEDNPHKLPSVTIYPRSLEDTKTEINALTDDELLIMSYRVFGFVLRDRTWGESMFAYVVGTFYRLLTAYIAQLDLSHLEHIDNSDGEDEANAEDDDSDSDVEDMSAFGRLVLPKGHKKMILSLIAQHFRNKGSQDKQTDIVRGKGTLLPYL